MAAPFRIEENATWNWTAKNAPEEKPETEVWVMSIEYPELLEEPSGPSGVLESDALVVPESGEPLAPSPDAVASNPGATEPSGFELPPSAPPAPPSPPDARQPWVPR